MRKHARAIGLVVLTVAMLGWSSVKLGRKEPTGESFALSALKVLISAQSAYRISCGSGSFAGSVEVLQTATPGGQPFLPLTWNSLSKSSYVVTVQPGAGATPGLADCNGNPTYSAYYATAMPIAGNSPPGAPPQRAFASNAAGTIWQRLDGVVPREPFGAPATPIQ